MATANAMFGRLSASYRRLFAPGTDPSVVLVHGRRDLCEGFRSLPRKLAYDDHCDEKSDDPSEITASAFCADWIARSNKQAFLAQMRKWEPGRSTRLFSRFCRPAIRRYVFGGSQTRC